MSGRHNAIRAALPLLGGVLLVLGEHLWGTGAVRPYLSLPGAALLLAALAWNARLAWRIERGGNPAARNGWSLLWPPAAAVTAAAIYGAGLLLPEAPAEGSEGLDLPALAAWGWVFAALFGAVVYLFVEMAWLAQAGAPVPDGRRLRFARQAGVSLGLLLLIVVTLNFVFNKLPWSWDLGYFRTAEAGEATRETVRNLDAPVEVALFFPDGNAVGALVRDYFLPLEDLSSHLSVSYHDAELDPQAAQDFRARRNGLVVVRRDEVTRNLTLALEVDDARDKLAGFDSDFLKELARITREKRIVYFTVGHGERHEKGGELPDIARIKGFEALLRAQNYVIKPLGLSEGLGSEVPADAFIVVVTGPNRPFRPSEEEALARYLEGGGRLLLFLEPVREPPPPGVSAPPGPPLAGLLAAYGVAYRDVVQANDRVYGRRTRTKADYALLATARYQSHPAVQSLRRNASQFPLLFLESGAWELGEAPEGLRARQIVLGMPGTWGDRNRNFAFDAPAETRGTPPLAVAIGPAGRAAEDEDEGEGEPASPRVVAYADADVAADLFIQNRANQLALLDAVAWLADDPAPAAAPDQAEDLKIQHLKGDEVVWFYVPVFGVPLLVLAVGYAITRRGRRQQVMDDA